MDAYEFPALSWSVSLDGSEPAGERAIDELVRSCVQTCEQAFVEAEEFTLTKHSLSGALEGTTLKLTTGDFRGVISVQRFMREHAGTVSPALRLVAAARFEPSLPPAPLHRSSTRWGLASCTLGSLGVGAVALQLAGFITTWSQIVYVLPALMLWRLYMAVRIALDLQREAQAEAERNSQLALAQAEDSPLRQARARWDGVLRFLAAQRDVLTSELHHRPFRSAAMAGDEHDHQHLVAVAL